MLGRGARLSPSDHPSKRAYLRIRRTRSRYAPPRTSRFDDLGESASPRNDNRPRCSSSTRRGFPIARPNPAARDPAFHGSLLPSGSRLHYWLAPSQVPSLRNRVHSLYLPIHTIIATKRRMWQASDIGWGSSKGRTTSGTRPALSAIRPRRRATLLRCEVAPGRAAEPVKARS